MVFLSTPCARDSREKSNNNTYIIISCNIMTCTIYYDVYLCLVYNRILEYVIDETRKSNVEVITVRTQAVFSSFIFTL